MILDEQLFTEAKNITSHDLLDDLGYKVFGNDTNDSDYYISKRNPANLEKAREALTTAGIPFKERKLRDRYFLFFDYQELGKTANTAEAIKTKKGMRKLKALTEDASNALLQERLYALNNYPTYHGSYTRPVKVYDLGLTPEQDAAFSDMLEEGGLEHFWWENEKLSKDIYQTGRLGGHLILDQEVLDPNDFNGTPLVKDLIDTELANYYYEDTDGDYSLEDKREALDTVTDKINSAYTTLMDFDRRVDQLIENLKQMLDGYVKDEEINSDETFPKTEALDESLDEKRTFKNGDSKFEIWPDGKLKFYDKDTLIIDSKALAGAEDFINSMTNSGFVEECEENLSEELINNVDIDSELKKIFSSDKEHPYMMLNRLKSDCDYYLGYGNRVDKHLWAGSPEAQIAMMKGIWDNLEEKPEWLTIEQLEDYEHKMLDSSEIVEALTEDTHEDVKAAPEEGIESAGATLLNKLIVDEWEAIQGYNDAIVALAAENKLDIVEVLTGIQNEENKHVGELQELMKQLTPSAEIIADGEQEAGQEIATSEANTEDIADIESDIEPNPESPLFAKQ